MSGFDFPIRHIGEGQKSDLKRRREADLAFEMLHRLKPASIFLNRAIALGKAGGPEEALAELKNIPDAAKLKLYSFYPAAQGEFHLLAGLPAEAGKHFAMAVKLARNRSETNFLEHQLKACE